MTGTEYVLLGQNKINWVDIVKHFTLNTSADSNDCMMKRSTFIRSVNKLMTNFGHLQTSLLRNIFKTFCIVLYCIVLYCIRGPILKAI